MPIMSLPISTDTPCSMIAACCTEFRDCCQEYPRYACCDLRCQNVRHASYPIQQGFSRSSDDLGYLCWKRQAMIPLTNGFKSQLDELLMAALIQVRSGAAVSMQISMSLPYNLSSSIKTAASTIKHRSFNQQVAQLKLCIVALTIYATRGQVHSQRRISRRR